MADLAAHGMSISANDARKIVSRWWVRGSRRWVARLLSLKEDWETAEPLRPALEVVLKERLAVSGRPKKLTLAAGIFALYGSQPLEALPLGSISLAILGDCSSNTAARALGCLREAGLLEAVDDTKTWERTGRPAGTLHRLTATGRERLGLAFLLGEVVGLICHVCGRKLVGGSRSERCSGDRRKACALATRTKPDREVGSVPATSAAELKVLHARRTSRSEGRMPSLLRKGGAGSPLTGLNSKQRTPPKEQHSSPPPEQEKKRPVHSRRVDAHVFSTVDDLEREIKRMEYRSRKEERLGLPPRNRTLSSGGAKAEQRRRAGENARRYSAKRFIRRVSRHRRYGLSLGPAEHCSLTQGGRLKEDYTNMPNVYRHLLHFGPGTIAVSGDFRALHLHLAAQQARCPQLGDLGYIRIAELILGPELGEILPRQMAKRLVGLPAINGSTAKELAHRLDQWARDPMRASDEQYQVLAEYGEGLIEHCEEGMARFRSECAAFISWTEGLQRDFQEWKRDQRRRGKCEPYLSEIELPNGVILSFTVELDGDGRFRRDRSVVNAVLTTMETAIMSRVEHDPRIAQYPILDMHDGLSVIMPEADAVDGKELVRSVMLDAGRAFGFSLAVKIGAGRTWGESEQNQC